MRKTSRRRRGIVRWTPATRRRKSNGERDFARLQFSQCTNVRIALARAKEVFRFFLTFTPPPSSSHERSIRENPSRFPRGTDVTRATADARRRRRRRRHERFDVRPALVETRGARRRPSARRDDDARDDATANGYPKIMSRRSTARKTEPTRAHREPND